MKKLLIIPFILLCLQIAAQHEADYWYFGNFAGLDFSSGKPEPLTDGKLKNYEGCAVLSDSAGNLLFYTNGITVWDKTHHIMENGTGLSGDTSSTQSAIIIPRPGNDSLYYIFTADVLFNPDIPNYSHKGLKYSLVNMHKNNNTGEIVAKNITLLDSVTEKITAVKHSNNKDIWLISHEWGSNNFYAWLINENGISASPVISSQGYVYQGSEQNYVASIGYMKASPAGDKLCVAILRTRNYEMFDFDNSTGVISYVLSIPLIDATYGCEFSPDGSKLYLTDRFKLFQVNLDAGSEQDILNSLSELCTFNSDVGAIQNANNGKIYISRDLSDSLSVINKPDSLAESCDFVKNALYLDGRKSRIGLPNFMQSFFRKTSFAVENVCFGDTSIFTINDSQALDSLEWNFGDPNSGTENTSRELNPKHRFSSSGLFNVHLVLWFNNTAYHYKENIKIVPLPPLNLGQDTVFCIAKSHTLSAYSRHCTYLWNDNSSDSLLTANTSGQYHVKIENMYTACQNSDTVNLIFSDIPELNLGNDTSFCAGTSFIIDAWHEGYSYLWQDSSTSASFMTDTAGIYYLSVSNPDGCTNSDTIELSHTYAPEFDLGKDTLLCEGEQYLLQTGIKNARFLWQNGSTDSVFYADLPGIYSLKVTNSCGFWKDSVFIDFEYCGPIVIPNVITPNNDAVNECFFIKGIEHEAWILRIYSRWGNLVYFSPDYQNNWFAEKIGSGVYYYYLICPQKNEKYTGTVRVIK